MRFFVVFLFIFCTANGVTAQDQEIVIRVEMANDAPNGVVLRGLDRISGRITDIVIKPGEIALYERLKISLSQCKYPEGEEQVEAFAYLEIQDIRNGEPAFEGWMFASSPALSALDHPRYDVWVLRCNI